jgi:beta-lactamase class A
MLPRTVTLLISLWALFLPDLAAAAPSGDDAALGRQLQAIAAAHHGKVALYATNLRTGQTAALSPDTPVKTASVIKLGILLDAAEQIRAGQASFDEKLTLTKPNQVEGSGVLGELTPPLPLTLRDTLLLMVILSDNTATNLAIDRLGLDHINATLRAAGLKQTVLYKKVYVPATGPMPPDQPLYGLGKTTAREMASIMERFATCNLSLSTSASNEKLAAPQVPQAVVCASILDMLRHQQDRDSLPRYLETLDTSEAGSAIANKTGALDAVRNDVALIASKNGPIVIAAFTWDNTDQRWTGDNEAEQTLGKLAKAVVDRWSPQGLAPAAFPWQSPSAAAATKEP